MDIGEHARVTGSALKNWLIGQIQDSIIVGLMWLIGLWLLKVPLAPFWALLAGALQFIPQVGAALGMVGPVLAASLKFQDWEHPLYVLILYAAIVLVDGLGIAAIHHATRGQGSHVGLDSCPHRDGFCYSVLGSIVCASAISRPLCI